MRSHTVVVVDDHALLAYSLVAALRAEGHDAHVACLGPRAAIVDQVDRWAAGVVVLDLDLGPGHEAGDALTPVLCQRGVRVVVVTACSDPVRLTAALDAGATAVLSKTRPFVELLQALTAAAQGRPAMTEDDRRRLQVAARLRRAEFHDRLEPFARLTARESQVLALLIEGVVAEDIAERFVVSTATVRTQVRGVLTKLGVRSQLAAVAEARRAGWQPESTGQPGARSPCASG